MHKIETSYLPGDGWDELNGKFLNVWIWKTIITLLQTQLFIVTIESKIIFEFRFFSLDRPEMETWVTVSVNDL